MAQLGGYVSGTAGNTLFGTYAASNQGDDSVARDIISKSGTMQNLYVTSNYAPGSGESYTITVQKNGSDTSLTCTIEDSETSCNTGLLTSFSVAAGDYCSAKIEFSSAAADATVHLGYEYAQSLL